MSSRGRRGPSEEDRALWARVTRSVTPLRKPSAPPAAAGRSAPPPPHKPPAKASARTAAVTHTAATKPSPAPAPLAPIDRRLKARLKRGTQAIDARIDLHGMIQSEAHAALVRFLRQAQRDGARFALVITGKGVRGSDDRERGVLRRQVPLWLRLPEFRPYVIGFEAAHVGHGGEGALYLRIRKSGDR
jgi:DNA-nicking Smr family endonuclease